MKVIINSLCVKSAISPKEMQMMKMKLREGGDVSATI